MIMTKSQIKLMRLLEERRSISLSVSEEPQFQQLGFFFLFCFHKWVLSIFYVAECHRQCRAGKFLTIDYWMREP